MNEERPRFQISTRDLLEIVFWISVGVGAIRGTILILDTNSPAMAIPLVFLAFTPGVTFGTALGVILRKRAEMAVIGFHLWLLVIGAGLAFAAAFLIEVS